MPVWVVTFLHSSRLVAFMYPARRSHYFPLFLTKKYLVAVAIRRVEQPSPHSLQDMEDTQETASVWSHLGESCSLAGAVVRHDDRRTLTFVESKLRWHWIYV